MYCVKSMETLLNFLLTYSMHFIKTFFYKKKSLVTFYQGQNLTFFTTSKHTDPTSNQILHKMYVSYYYKCVDKIIKTIKFELSYKVLLSGNSALCKLSVSLLTMMKCFLNLFDRMCIVFKGGCFLLYQTSMSSSYLNFKTPFNQIFQ